MNIREIIKVNEFESLSDIKLESNAFDNFEVKSISYDSRNEGDSAIFFAAYGAGSDGNEYIDKAVLNNYKIIVTDKTKEELEERYNVNFESVRENDATIIKVDEVNEMLALASERFYNFPANDLKLIGVTGTNGKTTTTSLIFNTLRAFNEVSGLIGTMEIHYDDEVEVSKNTTPDAPKLQSVYRKMLDKNCKYNVMEVSSHSLALKRVWDEVFEVGVYTNLTEDHLDYHLNMENYRDSKLLLFNKSKNCALNLDTEYSNFYIEKVLDMNKNTLLYGIYDEITTSKESFDEYLKELNDKYSLENKKDVEFLIATDLNIDITGSKFKVIYVKNDQRKECDVNVKTPGRFSVYNALSSIGTLILLGYEIEKVVEVIKTLPGITGRFQTFMSSKGYGVAVDYAHSPDGLLNILNTAKSFVKGKIITVFGCGGDRDKLKRPIMGRIVMELSDIAIVTSDNPRTEDPEAIIDDIEVGMKEFNKEYLRIADRYEATKKAIEMANSGDFVIIAGKGHEDYQIIGKEKIHFSDIENVQELIKAGK